MIMSFAFDGTRARWVQIYEVITARIENGTYPAGSRVPSVVAITSEFGVAQATAQKVLTRLRADGWTRTEPGMGSFVVKRQVVD